jgi:hypothetical protein
MPEDTLSGAAEKPPLLIQIVLDVGPDEPIQGTLRTAYAHSVPFRGWLALTALIEAARKHEADARPSHG